MKGKQNKKMSKKKVVVGIILAILIVIVAVALIAVRKLNLTLGKITGDGDKQISQVAIYVLKDCEAEDLTDLSEYAIGVTKDADKEEIKKVKGDIKKAVGGDVSYAKFEDVVDMTDALYDKTINAMIMNRAYEDVIKETKGYDDFMDKVKVIYSTDIMKYINLVDDKKSNVDQFVLYISGIDTWGGVTVRSRSDVNILAVVNTKTRHIQLINTPRDYYVALPNSGGQKDKLTHAGIYGVENSIGALEDLYGVKVDYYLRMNFSGFEKIIDSLGGVDVYSENDFTVEPIKHYKKGMNHLTGLEALAFARERHALANGDVGRGQNQMALITAMVNKMASSSMLYHYTDVLDGVSDAFQTNMTSDEIYTLVKKQLRNSDEWKIDSYSVTGTGGKEATFSTPNTLCYVMLPNEDDIATAKKKINSVLKEK